jgi:hypothetical protein
MYTDIGVRARRTAGSLFLIRPVGFFPGNVQPFVTLILAGGGRDPPQAARGMCDAIFCVGSDLERDRSWGMAFLVNRELSLDVTCRRPRRDLTQRGP